MKTRKRTWGNVKEKEEKGKGNLKAKKKKISAKWEKTKPKKVHNNRISTHCGRMNQTIFVGWGGG
jgi:hypothetical protein